MLESIDVIIVPTDFSEFSENALRCAAQLARAEDAALHLLHAVRLPFFHTTYDINIPQRLWDDMTKAAQERLDELRDRLTRDGVARIETLVSDALQPAELVAKHANERNADLVVMATHGRRGLKHAFLGSVTEETLRISPVPVLAVKQEPAVDDWIRRILVPIDFSVDSDTALELALSLARRRNASLELLHVLGEAPDYARALSGEFARFETRAEAISSERLVATAAKLEKQGLRVYASVCRGYPPEVIARQASAEETDLIVMGTHGHRGFNRLALGSVTERTLRIAPCPVLTTRAPERDPIRNGARGKESR